MTRAGHDHEWYPLTIVDSTTAGDRLESRDRRVVSDPDVHRGQTPDRAPELVPRRLGESAVQQVAPVDARGEREQPVRDEFRAVAAGGDDDRVIR